MLSILQEMQLEGFLWGLGTAIGELPPYFVAKKASMLGEKHEELQTEENELLKDSETMTKAKKFFQKLKKMIFAHMEKHSFITVTLMASIPNPLFDLAGLTCGHLQIPFLTFFLATFIGKAIFKVHIQLFFIVFGFSDKMIKLMLRKISQYLSEDWSMKLSKIIEKQKQSLTGEQVNEDEFNLIGFLWNCVLTIMILYFVCSVVNSVVKEYYLDQQKKENNLKVKKEKNN
jgi:membrane protein YqaA with SNARE-associated domain